MEVVIVGAGVVGLSTALALSESSDRFNVTIIADLGPHDPTLNTNYSNYRDYTSAWAGAHYRPAPATLESEFQEQRITRLTYSRFLDFAEKEPESSVRFIKGKEFLENPSESYTLFKGMYSGEYIDQFKVLQPSELPAGSTFGTQYTTWVLEPPLYLQFLYRKLVFKYGVTFIKAKLESLRQVNQYVSNNPIIVNCSGTGLQYDGGFDPNCIPIRGQTLLLRPPEDCLLLDATITHQLKLGDWTFMIPRVLDGGVILGGTKQPNDRFRDVREEDTRAVTERALKLYPELFKTKNGKRYLDIVRVNVGFRPFRRGGFNTTVERKTGDRSNHVINNYGAGGLGFELSYGSGLKVYENILQLKNQAHL